MQKILNLILNEWNVFSMNVSTIALNAKRTNEIQFSSPCFLYQSVNYRMESKQIESDTKVNYRFKTPFLLKLVIFPFYLIYIILVEIFHRLPIFDDDL